jgi:hypothetical protein
MTPINNATIKNPNRTIVDLKNDEFDELRFDDDEDDDLLCRSLFDRDDDEDDFELERDDDFLSVIMI